MSAQPGTQTSDANRTPEPSLSTIMAAISDLKQTLEPKLDAVTIDVSLVRADFKKLTEKATRAETHIQALKSMSKRLEEHVQLLAKLQKAMEARLEDMKGETNNIRLVGVPEGAEGPSVDLFQEDLILNELRTKRISTFFSVDNAQCAPIPPPKPGAPLRAIIARILNYRNEVPFYKQPALKGTYSTKMHKS
ncbi:hypothetical protein NDU88_005441 [Pleurodeles waltl]|uniref:Uncharacterized protein n=1 Tax=Pleurodeles waltl TaxID=8319 RepID=A0AAV7MWR3_PLEWA|nr:hypothetical protein NDU88_005441 [Pleurodeles waltl]